jgi:hypothetical protein
MMTSTWVGAGRDRTVVSGVGPDGADGWVRLCDGRGEVQVSTDDASFAREMGAAWLRVADDLEMARLLAVVAEHTTAIEQATR